MKAAITVHGLRKRYGRIEVLNDLNLEIPKGKITAIIGPNGSGKSTFLNILSGVVAKDGGDFEVKNFDPYKFSYIFQNYRESLLPWLTNRNNLAFPLEIQKRSKKFITQKIDKLQKYFEFNLNLQSYPYELSGGQQQIMAFMRAFITGPKILFIDEPFSALDYENNLRLRGQLQKYYLKNKPTILLITHNIEEAVHLAEKIIIFSQKPAKVLKVIDNPLPYPRTLRTLKGNRFNRITEKVLSAFQEVVKL